MRIIFTTCIYLVLATWSLAAQIEVSFKFVEIDESHAGQRIDNFLIRHCKIPKSRIYQMLRKGEVRVNKGRIKPTHRLEMGDVVRIPPFENTVKPKRETVENKHKVLLDRIIYEDKDILVVDKPSGMAVHGGSGVHAGVIEAMRLLRPEIKFMELAHRLDKDTSGCLIIAKSRKALTHCHEEFREGRVKKIYHARVAGKWPKNLNKVELALEKNQGAQGERKVRVSTEGKTSKTTFQILKADSDSTLLEVHLHTGRTHQIRVHCMASGYPIIGDVKYGDNKINAKFAAKGVKRLCLHCYQMMINVPSGEVVKLHSESGWHNDNRRE